MLLKDAVQQTEGRDIVVLEVSTPPLFKAGNIDHE